MKSSSAVQVDGMTILDASACVLASENRAMSPYEIAQAGLRYRLFRIPRFRTRSYLTQLVQSTLHDNARYSHTKVVRRPATGKYRLTAEARRVYLDE